MLQCQACSSWNDDSAAFCSQCGQSTGRKGRGGSGLLYSAILFAGLVAMAAWFLLYRVEPGPVAPPSAPASAVAVPPVPEKSSPPAELTDPGKPVAPGTGPVSIREVTPSNPQPRPVDVGRSLATLVLIDKEGRPAREMPAVVVHPDGVLLSRYSPLLGVYKVNCRRAGIRGTIPVTGIIRYNQPADLVLLRLARTGKQLPALDIQSREKRQELASEDEIEVYEGPGARLAKLAEVFYTSADGHSGILLEDSPGIDAESFLAVSKSGAVLGLCRPLIDNVVGIPRRTIPARPQGLRIFIDPAGVFSREALLEPISGTVAENTIRIYEGTFDDLEEQARINYRKKHWAEAIRVLEQALERGHLENVEDVRLDRLLVMLRESYLGEVGRLQNRRRFEEAAETARSGLEMFGRDGILWFKLAEVCAELELTRETIEALLQVKELESSRSIVPMLEGAYHDLARKALKVGDARQAELAYIDGLEQLPESAIMRFNLGQLYQEWGIYADAIRLLEEAKQFDSSLAQQADILLGRIDDILSSRGAVVIPIPEGALSLRAKIAIDGRLEENFIIDTGASYTAISESLARKLGYAYERGERVNVTTANGRMQVRRIRLGSVSLQGYAVHNLPVIVLPDTTGRSLNLLGLNFLNNFRYSVDSNKGEFRLERP